MNARKHSFIDFLRVVFSLGYIKTSIIFTVVASWYFLIPFSIKSNYTGKASLFTFLDPVIYGFILMVISLPFYIFLCKLMRSTCLSWHDNNTVKVSYRYSFFSELLIDTSLIRNILVKKANKGTQHPINIYLLDRSNYLTNIKKDDLEEFLKKFEKLNIEVNQK